MQLIKNGIKQLTSLNLNYNQIKDISSLKDLKQLTSLYLNYNQIKDISSLKDLKQLTSLHLSSNQIEDIEDLKVMLEDNKELEIVNQITYCGISLKDNPLKNPPMSVVKQGRDAVLSYFKEEKIQLNYAKVIILGNTSVGKTTLVNCFPNDNDIIKSIIDNYKENNKSTDGMSIVSKKLGDINIGFWDFGGQDYFHSTYKLFLDGNIFLILLTKDDLNIKEGGEYKKIEENNEEVSLMHFPPSYWLNLVKLKRKNKKDNSSFIIQSKCDMRGKSIEKVDYKISLKDIAKDKEESIYLEAWQNFVEKLKKIIKNKNEKRPKSWKSFLDSLDMLNNESINRVPFAKLLRIYTEQLSKYQERNNKINKSVDEIRNEFEMMLRIFKEMGRIVYFSKELDSGEKINDDLYIYTNPKYVTNTIYKILDRKKLVEKHKNNFDKWAIFITDDIDKSIFDDENEINDFLEIMIENKIIFENGKNKNNDIIYIAPQYLPELEHINEKEEFEKFRDIHKRAEDGYEKYTLSPINFGPMFMVNLISKFGSGGLFHKNGVIHKNKTAKFTLYLEKDGIELKIVFQGDFTIEDKKIKLNEIHELIEGEKVKIKGHGISMDISLSEYIDKLADKEEKEYKHITNNINMGKNKGDINIDN